MKKIIATIIFIITFSSIIYGSNTDVNTEGSDNKTSGAGLKVEGFGHINELRGARVSLYNIDTQKLIYSLNMMSYTSNYGYNRVKNLRWLSELTKPEIIALHNLKLNDELRTYTKENSTYHTKNLVKDSVKFPDLYFSTQKSAEQRTQEVKEFYKKEENKAKILNYLYDYINEEQKKLFENKKAVLLIEPLICLQAKGTDDNHTWVLTCAELGLLANSGLAQQGEMFSQGNLTFCYNFVSLGTYKETDGLINCIYPYDDSISETKGIQQDYNHYKKMIKMLGCLEISQIKTGITTNNKNYMEYYTDNWVITSIKVSTIKGFPYQSSTPETAQDLEAKNNCLPKI